MIGIDVPHKKIDVDELQSLDLREIVEHKARTAYAIAKQPVLVEDTRLVFHALGRLPGTYVKWFLQELDVDGLCKLLDSFDDRSATAGAAIAYFDGKDVHIFESSLKGRIANRPVGDSAFGWNPIFIPGGADKTLGQMSDTEFRDWYGRVKPFSQVADFLRGKK